MKKVITIILVVLFFSECKKGEEDPLISFRSRNNRLMGTWDLKSETFDICIYPSTNFEERCLTGEFSNGLRKYNDYDGEDYELPYSYTLSFNEDGTYKKEIVNTYTTGATRTTIENGFWSWKDSNKKKNIISLYTSNAVITIAHSEDYSLLKLSNSNLKLTRRGSIETEGPEGISYERIDQELSFEKEK